MREELAEPAEKNLGEEKKLVTAQAIHIGH
jgi:hypothetical protein